MTIVSISTVTTLFLLNFKLNSESLLNSKLYPVHTELINIGSTGRNIVTISNITMLKTSTGSMLKKLLNWLPNSIWPMRVRGRTVKENLPEKHYVKSPSSKYLSLSVSVISAGSPRVPGLVCPPFLPAEITIHPTFLPLFI